MDTTRHDKVFKTSSPRTGRELDAMAGGGAGVVVGGGSSGSGGGGVRYHSELLGVVNSNNYMDTETAIHLTAEKLAEINSFYDKFLRKDTPDTAAEPITFVKGITVTGGASSDTLYVEKGATVGSLYVEETSSTRDLVVRRLAEILQLNVTEVATLARAIVKEFVSSETFIPGFAGEGFKIWQIAAGEWHGEIDSLTIRRSLNAFELLIQKYRAINGGLVISQGSGKIKSVTETDTHYLLEMEGDLTLMPDDFIRCQTWGTGEVEEYKFDFTDASKWRTNLFNASGIVFEYTNNLYRVNSISNAEESYFLLGYDLNPGESINISLKISGLEEGDKIFVTTGSSNNQIAQEITSDGTYTFNYLNDNDGNINAFVIVYQTTSVGEKKLVIEQVPEKKIETVTNKFYWVRVDGIEEGKVKVLKSEFDDGNQQPAAYPFDFNSNDWEYDQAQDITFSHTSNSMHLTRAGAEMQLLTTYDAPEGETVNITLNITGVNSESTIYTADDNHPEGMIIDKYGVYTFPYTRTPDLGVWGMFYKGTVGAKNILIEQIPEQPGFNSAWMFNSDFTTTHTLNSIHLTNAGTEQDAFAYRTLKPGESIRLNLQVTGLASGQEIRTIGGTPDAQQPVLITGDGTYKVEYRNTSDSDSVFAIGYKGAIGACDITVSIVPDSTNAPAIGDEVVQMGNATDITRQALILLSATDGKPCIDLLAGVNSKSFAGKLQMRAGCLDGIQDPDFPTNLQPSGYGLYCSNAFLKGSLVLRNGKSVDAEIEGVRTELTAIPGQITAAVSSVKEYTDSSVGSVREELSTNISAIPGQIKVEIGKMQIGASNLIPNSSFEEEGFFTGGNLGQYVERWGATPTDILPVAGNRFFALYTEERTDFFTGISHFFKVEPNTPYVFSIYLYRSNFVGTTSSYIWHYDSASDNYIDATAIPVPETAGKWERIIVPFTTKETETRIAFRLGFNSAFAGGAVLLADCVQLEKGTVPTAWREASADILSQTKSLIKAESDQLLFQVTRTTTGTRNYVLGSRMNRTGSFHAAGGGTVNLVTDEKFGTVVEFSRPEGGGEYQFVWELSNTAELNNNDVVFSVIAKRISETGYWNFGGWNTTFDLCRTFDSNQIDLGGGWVHYWATKKIDYLRGAGNTGAFGINTVSGTWRFYAVGVYKGNKPVDWTAAPEDLESRVSQAELNLQPDNIWLGISNKMSTSVLPRTKQTVDATGLDQNTYYPVTIHLSETEPYTITVQRSLWAAAYGVPYWSTHYGGFSVVCRWTTNGAGWGTIQIMRTVHDFRYLHSNVLPVGSIGQMTNGSREVIFVRGGSKYDIMVEGTPTADIMLHSTTFTEYGQSASPTTSIVAPEPNWDALTRTGINIDTKEITINAATTKIVSNGQVAALFTTDASGNPIIQGRFLQISQGATIAGFEVGEYVLSGTSEHAAIHIGSPYNGGRYVQLQNEFSANIVSYSRVSGADALYTNGPVRMFQPVGAGWNTPGVLAIYSKWTTGQNGSIGHMWGDGCTVTYDSHLGNSKYKYNHSLGHANYTVLGQTISEHTGFVRLVEKTSSYFVVQNLGTTGRPDSAAFDLIILGRNV